MGMMRSILLLFASVTSLALFTAEARAQYSVPAQVTEDQAESSSARIGSARSKIHGDFVRETGYEIGASMNFLTSEPSLGGEELQFTDLMLLRLHGLISWGDIELFAGTDILPKQPSYTNEAVWQGSMLGGRSKLGESFAVWARAHGGPMLDKAGHALGADAALQYKLELEDVLYFESALGVAHTQLAFDEESDELFFTDELFTKVGIAIREPRGHFGAWLNFDYYLPVASGGELDPQPRVNMHLGTLIGLSKKVDLFAEWTILDRGDLEDAQTTLPFLNGGFDQQQIIFGFMRRFGGEWVKKKPKPYKGPYMPVDPQAR